MINIYRYQDDSMHVLKTMRDCSDDKLFNVATLVFDEMKVTNTYEFDKKQQTVIGPHDNLQVIMMRGVASS